MTRLTREPPCASKSAFQDRREAEAAAGHSRQRPREYQPRQRESSVIGIRQTLSLTPVFRRDQTRLRDLDQFSRETGTYDPQVAPRRNSLIAGSSWTSPHDRH